MKVTFLALLVCALSGSANAGASGSKGHPIEKVIKMLQGLKQKAIVEGKQEAVAYEKFVYWCTTSKDTLNEAIDGEKETIQELEEKIEGLEKKKKSLEDDIDDLADELKNLGADAKAAKQKRKKEAGLYKKANDDLKSTIKAVEGCIKALKDAEGKTEPGMLLAQHHVKMVLALVSTKATEEQRQGLAAFANKPRPDQLAAGDLAKHTDKYDFKSENVIELLKQLKLKFEDDKLAGTKAETNSINAYDVAKEARDNSIEAAEDSKKAKEKDHGKVKADLADSRKDLKSTQDDLKADSKSLKDTTDNCAERKSQWEDRSKTRALEIEAMEQAAKILGKSTGVRTEAPGNPVPPPSPVAFLQLARSSDAADPKMKAVALIRAAAQEAHSRQLERLAVEIQAHLKGPFVQVNNMIEKMIFRLMDEQKQEDEHKLWCDQEIKKTNTMIEDKEDKIEELRAEIKVQTGKVGELTEEIADANKMIADVTSFMKEATEIRNTGKRENAEALRDSKQAQDSVTSAIAVLEAHYKESGEIKKEPWEFIQEPAKLPENPKLWDSSYTAVADPKNADTGIIAIMENVLSDFERMEADTKAQEAEDQKEYETSMSDSKIELAERNQEVKMKESEKARRNDKITSLSNQKKSTEGELEKTNQYDEDLGKACKDGDSSYEDRKAARAKEITALKSAKQTLADAFKEKFLQQPTKFLQINQHRA